MFILDDQQKIIYIRNEDGVRFQVKQLIDYSFHNLSKKVAELFSFDWAHVFVTLRSLTIDDRTYNLKTDLWVEFSPPKEYFGKEVNLQAHRSHRSLS